MIKKIYRLNENEVKKVLKYSKPFFSYGLVANIIKNNLPYNRFAIIIGSKAVNHNVSRNFFRRKYFQMVSKSILGNDENGKDIVFVVKKQTKLDKNNFDSINVFEKDISFLLAKIKK